MNVKLTDYEKSMLQGNEGALKQKALIKTGDRVRADGNKGVIEIIEKASD